MAFVKKTWKDRIVQYANRRLLTKSGGEVEQVTVTRDEGTISEAGDQFNASNMNNLEKRVKDAFDNLNAADLPIESGSATNTKDYIDNHDLKSFVVEQSGLTVTANSGLYLGDLSTLTGGRITMASQVKCISIINGYGTNYTLMGACAISVTNNIAIYPLRSDTNVTVRIGLIY